MSVSPDCRPAGHPELALPTSALSDKTRPPAPVGDGRTSFAFFQGWSLGRLVSAAGQPGTAGTFLLSWLLGGVLLFAATGCGHYRLGTGGTLSFATLYVAPVENSAAVPQAAAIVASQVRDAFLRDARVTLVDDPAGADAVLRVTLTSYRREIATSQPDDTGLARKWDLVLAATATLTDRRAGRDFFTARPLQVQRQAFTDSGQLQAEYQALPHLAAQLADRTAHAVLDVW